MNDEVKIVVPSVILVISVPEGHKYLGPFANAAEAGLYGLRELPKELGWHTEQVYNSYDELKEAMKESLSRD